MRITNLNNPVDVAKPIWTGQMGVGRHLSFWEGVIDMASLKINVGTSASSAMTRAFDAFERQAGEVGIGTLSPYAIVLPFTDTTFAQTFLTRLAILWLTPAAYTALLVSMHLDPSQVEASCSAQGSYTLPLSSLGATEDTFTQIISEFASTSADQHLADVFKQIRPNRDYFLKHAISYLDPPSMNSLPVMLHLMSWQMSTGETLAARSLFLQELRPCYLPSLEGGKSANTAAGFMGVYQGAALSAPLMSLTMDETLNSSFVNTYAAVGQLTASTDPRTLLSAWTLISGANRDARAKVAASNLLSIHNQMTATKKLPHIADAGAVAVLWYINRGKVESTADSSLLGAHSTKVITQTNEGAAGTTLDNTVKTVVESASTVVDNTLKVVSDLLSSWLTPTGLAFTGLAIGAAMFGPKIIGALQSSAMPRTDDRDASRDTSSRAIPSGASKLQALSYPNRRRQGASRDLITESIGGDNTDEAIWQRPVGQRDYQSDLSLESAPRQSSVYDYLIND